MNMDSPVDYHTQMKTELSICSFAADRYPCNYYTWSHRIWLMQHAYNCSTQVRKIHLSLSSDTPDPSVSLILHLQAVGNCFTVQY